jgi:uncharacterized YigZ family protein
MRTLATPHDHLLEVKKSRFRARAERLDDPDAAAARIAALGDPGATHNCFAYRVAEAYRFSDDGEPGGTAGRPILAAIDGQGLDHVLVVVTRWFGGIKLGSGGLVRAYGGCAAECLRSAAVIEVRPRVELTVHVPFEAIGAVYPVLEQLAARKLGEAFDDAGATLTVEIDADAREAFAAALGDATRGRATVG